MSTDDTARPAPPVDISAWPERERLAAVLIRDRSGVDDDTIAFYRSRYGRTPKDYWGEALETADAILADGFSRASAVSARALTESLETADTWAENGYSTGSKSYWSGVRDTLRVVLGITTETPGNSGDDAAAFTIIGAERRATRKAST